MEGDDAPQPANWGFDIAIVVFNTILTGVMVWFAATSPCSALVRWLMGLALVSGGIYLAVQMIQPLLRRR